MSIVNTFYALSGLCLLKMTSNETQISFRKNPVNCSQPNKENAVWSIQLRYAHTTRALVEEWRSALKPNLL